MKTKMANRERAKSYQRKRNWLTLIDLLLTLGVLVLIIAFNLQKNFLAFSCASQNRFLALFLFFFAFSLTFFIFRIPLMIYSFSLERHYELSNHTLASWLAETAKKEVLSFAFAAGMVFAFFAIVWASPERWWLWSWLAYTFLSVVMGQIFPIFIVPLFYKYQPLAEGELRSKIMALAARFGMKVENIYSLNLSKTTKKANAAFCGIGKTKRIILGDTLLAHFTNSEIETVLAHELGHFKHRDIWKQLLFGMFFSFAAFWISFTLLRLKTPLFGTQGVPDLGNFPWLCAIFYLFSLVMSPAGNAFSRHLERAADRFALEVTQNKEAFIGSMEKLSETNLADPNPHWLIEFLLYDHPAIGKRIQAAHQFSYEA